MRETLAFAMLRHYFALPVVLCWVLALTGGAAARGTATYFLDGVRLGAQINQVIAQRGKPTRSVGNLYYWDNKAGGTLDVETDSRDNVAEISLTGGGHEVRGVALPALPPQASAVLGQSGPANYTAPADAMLIHDDFCQALGLRPGKPCLHYSLPGGVTLVVNFGGDVGMAEGLLSDVILAAPNYFIGTGRFVPRNGTSKSKPDPPDRNVTPSFTAVQTGRFPALDVTPLAMVDIRRSALSQDQRRAVMAMVLSDAKTSRCPNIVRVAQPALGSVGTVFVVTGCESGTTGNALFWILLERASALQVLARTDHVQQVYVLRSAAHGFRDFVVATHESAFWSDLRLLRYDGKRYVLSRCAERVYDERVNKSAPPKVTSVTCLNLRTIPRR